jgi:hypothetical protein
VGEGWWGSKGGGWGRRLLWYSAAGQVCQLAGALSNGGILFCKLPPFMSARVRRGLEPGEEGKRENARRAFFYFKTKRKKVRSEHRLRNA